MKIILILLLYLYGSNITQAQIVHEPSTKTHPEWSKPYPPFQIAGNLYYVGTYDLACYLIVTSKGNILINTGLASSGRVIKESIARLGFKFKDVKILLTTQAHFDHMGAMAEIKRITGAQMMVDEGDVPVVTDGGRSDYDLNGNVCVFKPVKVDRILNNANSITLGDMKLTILHHPGHTKGSCSYLFNVKDQKRRYRVLIANMPTIVTNKKLSEVNTYPAIANDYAYTLNAMKHINFDIWLASHGTQFNLTDKHKPGSAYNPAAFMDKENYYNQIADLQTDYNNKINERRQPGSTISLSGKDN